MDDVEVPSERGQRSTSVFSSAAASEGRSTSSMMPPVIHEFSCRLQMSKIITKTKSKDFLKDYVTQYKCNVCHGIRLIQHSKLFAKLC